MMHTIYICKILSSLTFSLQSCIWQSLKVDQKTVGNGTPHPLYFLSFSLRSLLFFSPNSWFWWCIFCPNTYYHSIYTPVRSCCSRMWSGSEGHKLMNISFYLTLCATSHKSFLANESRKDVGAWFVYRMLGAGKTGMGRWRQDIQMLWEQLFKTAWSWPKLSLRLTVLLSSSMFYWRIWSSKAQYFWNRVPLSSPSPLPQALPISGLPIHAPTSAPALFPPQVWAF